MTVLGRVVFALLVGATFSAFFVAQRLRSAPAAIGHVKMLRFFSPNGDGHHDAAPFAFRVEHADDVTVDIVNDAGERVRRLATSVPACPAVPVRLRWDGRDDDGVRAADGIYRLRVALRRSGRSVVVPRGTHVDTAAPRPVVIRARRAGQPPPPRGPVIVQPGEPVVVAVRGATRFRRTRFAVWRTDGGRPREVARFRSAEKGSPRGEWDGSIAGQPAPVGTYLIVPTVQDKAGNRGTAPAQLPPQPGTVPGRPGVMVRKLAVEPPLSPVRAGSRAQFFVDSRGRPYAWSVRRVGAQRPVRKGRGKADAPLSFAAPGGVSGAYLLEVTSAGARTRVPFLVQSPERQQILVVLPAIGWLGEDAVDDDGDGLPNRLADGTSVRVPRPLAGGLPASFAAESAPLLAFLDRARIRYDVTTDLALAGGRDPSPTDRDGVLLAGPERWIPRPLALRLRRYVERGGRVAAFGADSLRRGVTLGRGQLVRPTQPTSTDAFGARLRPLRRLDKPVALVPLEDDPKLGLLEGIGDAVRGFSALEESVPAAKARLALAAGIGQDRGEDAPIDPETGAPEAPRPALAGSRLGKGVVIRVGLPQWGARLAGGAAVQQITRNVADILRGVRPRPRSPLR